MYFPCLYLLNLFNIFLIQEKFTPLHLIFQRYTTILKYRWLCFVLSATAIAVMSRLDLIAKKLNSVGLSATNDLRDALMDYFCEDDGVNNKDDSDNGDEEENLDLAPSSQPVNLDLDKNYTRPVFSHSICSDDTGTLDTMDTTEEKLVGDFMDKMCCHLKCTERFSKETVLQSRINAQELNHFSQVEHVNFLHVSLLGGLNCCVALGEETNYAKNKNHE